MLEEKRMYWIDINNSRYSRLQYQYQTFEPSLVFIHIFIRFFFSFLQMNIWTIAGCLFVCNTMLALVSVLTVTRLHWGDTVGCDHQASVSHPNWYHGFLSLPTFFLVPKIYWTVLLILRYVPNRYTHSRLDLRLGRNGLSFYNGKHNIKIDRLKCKKKKKEDRKWCSVILSDRTFWPLCISEQLTVEGGRWDLR